MKPFIFSYVVPAEMLDEFGHVHYQEFRNITEMAHKQLLANHNLDIASVTTQGFGLFMRYDECKYSQELQEGDEVSVELTCEANENFIHFAAKLTVKMKLAARVAYRMVVLTYPSRTLVAVSDSPFQALFA